MALRWSVRPNTYVDSVKLMRVSDELSRLPGVERAAAVMATPLNVDLLAADGLLPPGSAATPNDLLIAVRGTDEAAADEALRRVDDLLAVRSETEETGTGLPARRLEAVTGADLAVIAVPGRYATAEAFAALRAGMDVFLFSDNVPLDDEVALKRLAEDSNLLLMGPDCGTAILDGVGLGFANRVRPGAVGIVGASGTGIQQVCCLLDAADIGVAAAIGTGGRDLSSAVNGSMTRRALRLLDVDGTVEVLMLISKPPDEEAVQRLQSDLESFSTPLVACLLGHQPPDTPTVQYTATLTDAANAVITMLGGSPPSSSARLARSREGARVYGLFTGGTLASEAQGILERRVVPYQVLDLGADEYTRGRAHPIIDPRLRSTMLVEVVNHRDAGVVLLDVILGDLAHPDPASTLLPDLEALRTGSNPEIVITLLGTGADPQGLESQRAMLEAAGARVYSSNAEAAHAAADLVALPGTPGAIQP